ncbi:hypothetical protein ER13_04095 [Brevundimonas sp. EAKA]|jgi:uncharacterized protein (DUF736 family)|uniref:DUF736 domain-containing protein n=1 Tax=Brevundimonas sp. EAKA TaxID=1495854 RepID=UPI0004A9553D|nr:DUF736 domain-containing protein [Brevundimonas sp. EAKA]KDP95314.1 hypothetical protein ER13_04095 [Brevundimonas sp. EAKA]
MANIGTFTRDGDNFTGAISTLALKAKASLHPNTKTSDQAPDYRVYAGGAEIGAAWLKTSKGERPYLSVKLDDPSFPSAIFCRLVESTNGQHRLLWSR